jgi:electron transport complex protein RnfC
MIEHAADIHAGIAIVQRALGASRTIVAIEDDMSAAADALLASPKCCASTTVAVCKGAQRGERELVKEVLGKKVPDRGLAAQAGAAVFGANTIAQIGVLLPAGEGLTEQVVAISGPGVEHPGNYRVPIGTPFQFALRQAGVTDGATEITIGGAKICGAVLELDAPITKGVTGIVVLAQPDWHEQQKARLNLRSRVYGGRRK